MRANLENSLKSNNHMNESATIYFNFIRSVIERTEGMALSMIRGSLQAKHQGIIQKPKRSFHSTIERK